MNFCKSDLYCLNEHAPPAPVGSRSEGMAFQSPFLVPIFLSLSSSFHCVFNELRPTDSAELERASSVCWHRSRKTSPTPTSLRAILLIQTTLTRRDASSLPCTLCAHFRLLKERYENTINAFLIFLSTQPPFSLSLSLSFSALFSSLLLAAFIPSLFSFPPRV